MNPEVGCILVAFATVLIILVLQFIAAIISACYCKFVEKSTKSFWEIAFDEFVHMIVDCPDNV